MQQQDDHGEEFAAAGPRALQGRDRRRRVVASMAGALTLAACASRPLLPPTDVPAGLRVADAQVLTVVAHGTGVQIYACRRSAQDAMRFAWAFEAPQADLYAPGDRKIGRHYAGPTWEAQDGSRVVGAVVAHEDAANATAIPWLLLRAKSTAGEGLFAGTTFIQRLHTDGGQPPATGCDAEHAGQEAHIPYQADYYFYRGHR